MNKQTTTAFRTLKEIYGKPSWSNSPERKSIEEEWDKALEPYTEDQVRKACLRYAKFHNKANTFPTLTCIEAELVDVEVNQDVSIDKKLLANRMYVYCQDHAHECNPIPDNQSIQRAIWKNYGVAVGGYNPDQDKEWFR